MDDLAAGIVEAREPLLDVLEHPIRGVRRYGAFRIKQLASVDPNIVAEMQARLLPGDEDFMNLRKAMPSDLVLAAPATNNDYDPATGSSTGPGNSQGTSVSMPTCTDGVKNQTESDVDCGRACTRCVNGKACVTKLDCLSGTCNAGTCGSSGGGGAGSCSESTALDLGVPGNNVTVTNNACIRVRDSYPSWWGVRTMQLQTTTPGRYPVPFSWTNECANGSGSGAFAADWQNQFFGPSSATCATIINLQGDGAGTITVRYYAN